MTPKRDGVETPVPSQAQADWGSDHIADLIRAMGFRYVALNPGSSFRGLHDSLVNHLGNRDPQILLCLHEEHAVSIAHGWAKVTGEPMAVILHSNVGLMHASMAIYNAWCDRVPMFILGATGPIDAEKRRPWIDWIHTSRDQGAIVRNFVKWDDQPISLGASLNAMLRANVVTRTYPQAPTYVCLDVPVQEDRVPGGTTVLPAAPGAVPEPPAAPEAQLSRLANMLDSAERPVFLLGRMTRSEADWTARVALAEHYGAKVITDIKTGAVFPTDHPLHVGPPSFFIAPAPAKALAEADLVVAFDWVDLAGTLREAGAQGTLVNVTLDHQLANGGSLDHMGFPPARLHIAALPDTVIGAMARARQIATAGPTEDSSEAVAALSESAGPMAMEDLSAALAHGLAGQKVCFVRLPLGWDGGAWHFRHPLDYLGYDGGAGIASGPGMLIGASLALEGSDRIPVAVLGDGDVMMGNSALWTAARYHVPFIAVVCNNRSFFNDEVHQEKVARMRERPVENKAIGQAISGPDIDIAALARAQGVHGIGPVETQLEFAGAIAEALKAYRAGRPVLIDARVVPGYSKEMQEGMTETGG